MSQHKIFSFLRGWSLVLIEENHVPCSPLPLNPDCLSGSKLNCSILMMYFLIVSAHVELPLLWLTVPFIHSFIYIIYFYLVPVMYWWLGIYDRVMNKIKTSLSSRNLHSSGKINYTNKIYTPIYIYVDGHKGVSAMERNKADKDNKMSQIGF